MKSFWKFSLAAAILLAAFTAPVAAHHGTSNYAMVAQGIPLAGTVTEFVWANPHVYVLFDVKDEKGAIVHWAGEMNSPGVLKAAGWTKNTLKAGDEVKLTVRPNKAGTPVGLVSRANMLVNGKPLQVGPEQ
jgi:Family of unknown function (DUF6152)